MPPTRIIQVTSLQHTPLSVNTHAVHRVVGSVHATHTHHPGHLPTTHPSVSQHTRCTPGSRQCPCHPHASSRSPPYNTPLSVNTHAVHGVVGSVHATHTHHLGHLPTADNYLEVDSRLSPTLTGQFRKYQCVCIIFTLYRQVLRDQGPVLLTR